MANRQASDSKKNDSSTQKTSKSRAVAATTNAAPEAASPVGLEAALNNSASPTSILHLQRQAGNRAVQRMLAQRQLQAKLTVGPAGDKYEQEADKVAGQVMQATPATQTNQTPTTQKKDDDVRRMPLAASISPLVRRTGTVRRKIMPNFGQGVQRAGGGEGFEATTEVESHLRANTGGGRAMPHETRSFMESGFGADFSGVRVHTGGESNQLNRSLSAQAFTHGSDIYFGEGKYNPGTAGGKHLLAHELTHVVQQGQAKPNKVQTKPQIKKADDSEAEGPEVSSVGGKNLVQGSFFSKAKSKLKKFGQKIANPFKTAFGRVNKGMIKNGDMDNPMLDEMDAEERETYASKTVGSIEGATPDYTNPTLADQEPDSYKATLAIAQEDISWYRNIKTLKTTALKSLVTSPKKLFAGMEGYLAEKILSQRGDLEGKAKKEQEALVEKFTDSIHDVGHTWIRLSTYVGGQLKDLYSYGMYPQKVYNPADQGFEGGYGGFIKAGPGQIRHPDTNHEGDATKAYLDHDASPEKFTKALTKATKRYNNPPPYVLTGYNCTAFAREIFQLAGGKYPGSGMVLPGFAYTPGNLYWAVMKEWAKNNKNAYTNDKQGDVVKDVGKQKDERAETAQKEATVKNQAWMRKDVDDGADYKKLNLYKGHTIKYGEDAPNAIDKTKVLTSDMKVYAVKDEPFINIWGVVPIKTSKYSSNYWFVDRDDYKKAKEPMAKDPVDDTVDTVPDDGLPIYAYRSTKPPTAPEAQGSLDRSKEPYLEVDQHFDSGWTSISDQSEGSYYWVKTSDWDAFMNKGKAPTLDTTVVRDDTGEKPVSDESAGLDPDEYEAGSYNIPIGESITLHCSKTPGGPLDADIELHPMDKSITVIVEDALTSQYGVAKFSFFTETFYVPLTQIFSEDDEVSEDLIGDEDSNDLDDLSVDDDSTSEDSVDDELEDLDGPVREELDKVVSSELIDMLRTTKDLDMAVTSYGIPERFKGLSEKAREKLAELAKMSLVELNRQINFL